MKFKIFYFPTEDLCTELEIVSEFFEGEMTKSRVYKTLS
jgi:hypothetical protein